MTFRPSGYDVIAGLLVAAVLAVGVLAAVVPPPPIDEPTRWGPSFPVSTRDLFEMRPPVGVPLKDEELYLGTFQKVREGQGFYAAQHEMFGMNAGRWNTHSPLTYRQPIVTYIWLAVGGGAGAGVVWALLAGLGMVAAFAFARTLVRPAAALLAPAALALVFGTMLRYTPRLLYAEMWAAPGLVAAGALCGLALSAARRAPAVARRDRVLAAAGAVSALFALLVRELSLAPVAVMIAALVWDDAARRRRLWVPWAGAVGAWVVLFALHCMRARALSMDDPPGLIQAAMPSYLHPGLEFPAACIRWVSVSPAIVPIVLVLCVLAVVGAFALPSSGVRVLALGLTAGMLTLIVLVGTPGRYHDGSYTGYWGYLFVPVVLAWAPAGLRLVPELRVADRDPRSPLPGRRRSRRAR